MTLNKADKKLNTEHGTICSFPKEFFGYCGWPTLGRGDDGVLYLAASGFRNAHICPFGRTILCTSRDEGKTWSSPRVINDTPLDDRDAGIISAGKGKILVSWFTADTRNSGRDPYRNAADDTSKKHYRDALIRMTDENSGRWLGSWVRTSGDGGETWSDAVKIPVTAPHGPILLRDGNLVYLGKEFLKDSEKALKAEGDIVLFKSSDRGFSWQRKGTVLMHKGTKNAHYFEPHVVELPSGKLLGFIRFQDVKDLPPVAEKGLVHFSMMVSESSDGGETWSEARPLNFHGSPPHLMVHTSGAVVCTYGRRLEPYGERAMISRDEGLSWDYDYILRDDGPDRDLGYPSSVELSDKSILTAYYQKPDSAEDKCGILTTRWELPE